MKNKNKMVKKIKNGLAGILAATALVLSTRADNESLRFSYTIDGKQSNVAEIRFGSGSDGFNSGIDKVMTNFPTAGNSGAYVFQGGWPCSIGNVANNSSNVEAVGTFNGGNFTNNVPVIFNYSHGGFTNGPREMLLEMYDRTNGLIGVYNLTNVSGSILLPSPETNRVFAAATPLYNGKITASPKLLTPGIYNISNVPNGISVAGYNFPKDSTGTLQRAYSLISQDWTNVSPVITGQSNVTINAVDSEPKTNAANYRFSFPQF